MGKAKESKEERKAEKEERKAEKDKAKSSSSSAPPPASAESIEAGEEDAPEGHDAWTKIKFDQNYNRYQFQQKFGGVAVCFQVSCASLGGDVDSAGRLAR